MVNVKQAAKEIAKLSLLKFFPSDDNARAALVQMICGLAADNEQIEWLVRRTLAIFNEWPGPVELRALFCSRWKPRDGVEGYGTLFPATEAGSGFPRDPALPPAQLALPAPRSREISASPSLQRAVAMLADAKGLEAPRKHVATPEIPVVRLTAANAVTQKDIDAAVQANRDARAKAELGGGA